MGDRGNIYIEDMDIWFYSHWNGSNLRSVLKGALIRGRGRWSDPPYLARIIFSEMIQDRVLYETGYGISREMCDEDVGNPTIHVNIGKNTVNGTPFEKFVE